MSMMAVVRLASESVALLNLGFTGDQILSLPPGHAILIDPERGPTDRAFC